MACDRDVVLSTQMSNIGVEDLLHSGHGAATLGIWEELQFDYEVAAKHPMDALS